MDYALQTLQKEKYIVEDCLKGFNKIDYLEAFKLRLKRVNQLNKAIELIKT